ncbi:MAG: TonB-dependent receptor [Steroidobacteraceae bacterium]
MQRIAACTFPVALVLAVAVTEAAELEEVTVIGSRLPSNLDTMPISVNVISSEDIAEQLSITQDLQAVLGQLVPGLSLSNQATINTYTSIRGRKPVILVDSVPVTSTLNDVSRELSEIDPWTVERIEVVRGSSALFGNSAGAGFINLITKRGSRDQTKVFAEGSLGFSLTTVSDSAQPSVRLGVSGGTDAFDYLGQIHYGESNSFFDANGDRIPPQPDGISDSTFESFFGKLGFAAGEGRIEGSLSYHQHEQDAQFQLVPGNVVTRAPTTTIPGGRLPGEEPRRNEGLIARVAYLNPDAWGNELTTQLYYLDTESVFQFVPNRFPLTPQPNGQTMNVTEKFGLRLDFVRKFEAFGLEDGELLYGIDYVHDDTEAPTTDGRAFGLPQLLESYAAFLQAHGEVTPRWSVTAGVRYERADLTIGDFTSLFTLRSVIGATLDYDATPFNLGTVFELNDAWDVFVGFSQGFEVQQLSFLWRDTPVDIDLRNSNTKPLPNLIDSYESGIRFDNGGMRASFAVFYVDSSNGVTFGFNPMNPTDASIIRAPDRVKGAEISADWNAGERWKFGGSAAWMEGEADLNNSGDYETPLQNRRIPPAKVTGYVEGDLSDKWFLRVQGVWWDDRNEFPASVPLQRFHEGRVTSDFVLDLLTTYSLPVGRLSLGVNNLLNNDYYSNYSEGFNRNDSLNKAPGATGMIKYQFDF